MHQQMIHFAWKLMETWSNFIETTHRQSKPLFSWTNALTLIILQEYLL